ncbi:hypothetical protein [Streptomyces vietnamensis]|uniref:Uncharacterized protein n=1 Tax=Streptomyces vietnamensis TaxID=362257 RepID=A0A0B5I964_9ACTN|nr:hypothetical protein [Streptomyces vietnamensis]AJF64849.1 hypothetical protein SVTN_10810 [Streptomyces vietnamensis]
MSAADQDIPKAEAPEADEPQEAEEAQENPDSLEAEEESPESSKPSESPESPESSESSESPESEASAGGLTPKQARRLRVAAASVLLVALAVVLVIRLASRTSVLVVGVYGLAMILCGIVIELSRNGRTRLGTWLLAGGLLTALALDWLVLP